MKRLTARQYAEALAMVPAKSRSTAATQLLAILRRSRAMRLLPRIQMHLQRIEDAAAKLTRIHIEAASDADAKAAGAVIKKSIPKSVSQITIDSRHRAGFALRIGDRRIDATLRGQLQRLRTTLLR
jgi:F0F1-type ATP synthase delta subunit